MKIEVESKDLFRLCAILIGFGGLLGFAIGIADIIFSASLSSLANELNVMTTGKLLALISSIIQLVLSVAESALGIYSYIKYDYDEKIGKFLLLGLVLTALFLANTVFMTIVASFETLPLITGFLFSAVYLCITYKYNKEISD